jgi:hypothetical protein
MEKRGTSLVALNTDSEVVCAVYNIELLTQGGGSNLLAISAYARYGHHIRAGIYVPYCSDV